MEKWSKLYQGERESPASKQRAVDHEALQKEIRQFIEPATDRNEPETAHGYVWFFRRK